jgi:hypothetical protein
MRKGGHKAHRIIGINHDGCIPVLSDTAAKTLFSCAIVVAAGIVAWWAVVHEADPNPHPRDIVLWLALLGMLLVVVGAFALGYWSAWFA